MDKPCYCCDNLLIDPGTKENLNDLDGALNQLGMLSVSTDSRKQYLQEIVRQDGGMPLHSASESDLNTVQGGFCVFHMNKKFVTDLMTNSTMLSALKKSNAKATSFNYLNGHKLPIYTAYKEKYDIVSNSSMKIKSTRRRSRFHKPYELPWHHKLEERARTSSYNQENEIACIDENASSSSSSSSAGNRSNPGSPSKPGRVPCGSGLLRSRSLDDLTCPAWENNEEIPTQVILQPREEIENMSQQMRDLTVN